MHKHVRRAATVGLAAGALVLPLAAPAAAAAEVETLAENLAGPLGLSVGPRGDVYVAEAFAGLLSRVDADGEKEVVASVEGGEIAGVDATRSSQTAYVTTTFGPEPAADLRRLDHRGRSVFLADLQAWEEEQNPDGDVHYGFSDLPAGCTVADSPYGGTGGYDGIVEAHPYAVANVPGGWVVADAAGNSLIAVRRNGDVRTLAVLPAQTMTWTLEQVRAVNAATTERNSSNDAGEPDEPLLPECVAGHEFAFESVPTDVELGRDGMLYVSSLPGGPEDPSLGARGKVFQVDRRTGSVKEVATGFAAATDLAVTPDGTIYVAELFGGRISEVVDGEPSTVVELPLPSAVEYHEGALYATVDVFNQESGGSLVRIPVAGV